MLSKTKNCWTLFVAGAAVDFSEGFVGCMRALQVNGEMLDMMGKVERGEVTYGVSAGFYNYPVSASFFYLLRAMPVSAQLLVMPDSE